MLHIVNYNALGDGLMALPAIRQKAMGEEVTMYVETKPHNRIYDLADYVRVTTEDPPSDSLHVDIHKALGFASQHPGEFIGSYLDGYAVQLGAFPLLDKKIRLNHERLHPIRMSYRPVILFFPHSNSCASTRGLPANKEVSQVVWNEVMHSDLLRERHALCYTLSDRDRHALPILTIVRMVKSADCVVTVDNGISHLCRALDAKFVAIAGAVPAHWIWSPAGGRHKIIDFEGRGVASVTPQEITQSIEEVLS